MTSWHKRFVGGFMGGAAAVALLASSGAIAQSWRALMSPGPVHQDHQSLEDNCDACHLSFKGVPNEKCRTCHDALDRRISRNEGFHAKVSDQPCITCHTDHKGRKGSQTKDKAKAEFNHTLTGFQLNGAHSDLTCEGCHTKPIDQMGGSCGSCHDDPHRNRLGEQCGVCHQSGGWKMGLKTIERHAIDMTGGHTGLTCEQCHQGGRQLKRASSCRTCHQDKHGGTKSQCDVCHNVQGFKPAKFEHDTCTCAFPGKHQTFACLACHPAFKFADTPLKCSGCHQKDLTHDFIGECSVCHNALSWKNNRFDHNEKTSFAITGKHVEVDCNGCHTKVKRGKRIFKGAPTTCMGCHAKQGQQAHGDFGACEKCHTIEGFKPSSFDHASTGFPLVGKHAGLTCQHCHAEKTKGFPKMGSLFDSNRVVLAALGWTGWWSNAATAAPHTGGACSHCHDDPHKGEVGSDCASCHTPESFRPSTFTVERHQQTALPLTGKHTTTQCRLCHPSGQLEGIPTGCADCHTDRHRGSLGKECASCHTTASFRDVKNFDHARTGFTLQGAHQQVPCASCHGQNGERDLNAVAGPNACASCHTSRHQEFGGERGCSSCHGEQDTAFRDARPRFDHRRTGFGLERRHASVPCATCHRRGEAAPRAACDGCHEDPHMGQLTGDCADCHEPDRFTMVRFDHDRTAWPLRGRHFTTPCGMCHSNERWVGVPTDCWDCHALDAARAGHSFSRQECAQCHRSGWRW